MPYAAGLWIPQFRVEEVLRQCLAEHGQQMELATALTHIEQDEQGVTATLQTASGPEQVHCQYLVGAAGGHSFVRKSLQIGFAGEQLPGRLFAGGGQVERLDREHLHVWNWNTHLDGIVSLCPFLTTPVFQFQAQVPADFASEPSLAIFQQCWPSAPAALITGSPTLPGCPFSRSVRAWTLPTGLAGCCWQEMLRTSIRRLGDGYRHPGCVQPGLEARVGARWR